MKKTKDQIEKSDQAGEGKAKAEHELACEMRSSEHGAARHAKPIKVNSRQTAKNRQRGSISQTNGPPNPAKVST